MSHFKVSYRILPVTRITINGTDVFDWFKQKQKEFLNAMSKAKRRAKQRVKR